MDSGRRAALRSLAAAVAASTSCLAAAPQQRTINLVGFGGAGNRIVTLFMDQYPASAVEDYVGLANRERIGSATRVSVEPLSIRREPNAGPLVVVAGLCRSGGEMAFDFVRAWVASRSATVQAVFVYPLSVEGDRRSQGLDQAAKYIRAFGAVDVVDNEEFLIEGEERLLDLYQRANQVAVNKIARYSVG